MARKTGTVPLGEFDSHTLHTLVIGVIMTKEIKTRTHFKPCFCAREDVALVKFNDRCYVVVCKCGVESPKDSTSISGAARIWNRM